MPTFETARSGLMWDATAVPNAFFCEYMPSAPEIYVKVYLYGLMWAHGGVADDGDLMEEIAQALNLSRAEVDSAMRYWERCRLVERIQDAPPRYRFVSVQQVMLQRQQAPRDDDYEAFAQAVYAAFGDRRKLHGGETVLAFEWVEQFRLPPEVVLMLIQHMISTRGVNFSFKEAQKVAVELCEQHVSTLEEAEAIFSRSEAAMKGTRRILSHLGMRRNPSMDEMDLYLKWTEQWGFEPKAIREACKETVKGTPNFAYLDKVLEGIYSRSSGKALTEEQVEQAISAENEETARVRELLNALGISMAAIDGGMRLAYGELAGYGGHELVMLAAREVVRSGKVHTLDRVKVLLEAWTQKGMTTVEAVNAYLAEVEMLNRQILALMESAGASGGRTQANRARLKQWQDEWHISGEMLHLAAEYARGTREPFAYMHKVIAEWHEKGVASLEEARAAHERHVSESQSAARSAGAPAAAKRVIEQQYEQRTYDPAEYDEIPADQLEEMKKL